MNKTLTLFIGCFIAPALLALIALKLEWFEPAKSNNGQFLQQAYRVPNWPANNQKKWSLLTFNSKRCEQSCQQKKQMVKNVYDVLGKHNLYVGAYAIEQEAQSIRLTSLIEQQNIVLAQQTIGLTLEHNALYLVDHRGLVVLRYPVRYSSLPDAKMKKGLIKDLKKLLNYSRSRA